VYKDKVYGLAREFSAQTHGSSDYDKDPVYVMGSNDHEFAPWEFLKKNIPDLTALAKLKAEGFVYSSYDFLELTTFDEWYQKQFQKRLSTKVMKTIGILHRPDQKTIFDTVEVVHKTHQILKDHKVLINGKNLPDFKTDDGKVVEVKVHWHDATSPKGVKIKKSLAELSDYCVIMYVAKNFTIRDILFLDSEFVLRKFDTKGHTIFLKDQDVQSYFFTHAVRESAAGDEAGGPALLGPHVNAIRHCGDYSTTANCACLHSDPVYK